MENYDNRSGRGHAATESRKQAVSIRMNRSDVRTIKRLANRLGARDSDVIRFAIKLMLGKLALFQDLSVRGRRLVPALLEAGPELMRHFELDAAKLNSIINEGVEPEQRVDSDDLQLIAMAGLQRSYVKLRVAGFRRPPGQEPGGSAGPHGNGERATNGHGVVEDDALEQSLRQYLYEKYLFADVPIMENLTGTGGK